MDEHELEQAMRAGLEGRAAEADVTAPVVARARAEVGRRRRTRWGVGAAAAAVVLLVGGVAVATQAGDDDAKEPPIADDPTTTDDGRPGEETGWRTEYWQGIAVDVPADWGYGGAPAESGGEVLACFPEAYVGPDGSHLERPGERGWVGRPIMMTDVCALYPWIENSPQEEPTQPYVWLGAAVEPGVVEYTNGYVEETVEVDGVVVTVASDDAALREEVLGSARASDEPACAPRYAHIPTATNAVIAGAAGEPYAWVCAYRRIDGDTFVLAYAHEVASRLAEQALEAELRAPDQRADCDYDPFEFALLESVVPGDTAARTVYETGCAGGTAHLPTGETKQMVPAGVDPWAENGIRAVLSYLIGPQG